MVSKVYHSTETRLHMVATVRRAPGVPQEHGQQELVLLYTGSIWTAGMSPTSQYTSMAGRSTALSYTKSLVGKSLASLTEIMDRR